MPQTRPWNISRQREAHRALFKSSKICRSSFKELLYSLLHDCQVWVLTSTLSFFNSVHFLHSYGHLHAKAFSAHFSSCQWKTKTREELGMRHMILRTGAWIVCCAAPKQKLNERFTSSASVSSPVLFVHFRQEKATNCTEACYVNRLFWWCQAAVRPAGPHRGLHITSALTGRVHPGERCRQVILKWGPSNTALQGLPEAFS